ncbi:pogo transposable element with KRAB domain [Rhizophagus clarus]|uniref:Pogo transposable element with KRAB domain n=1 Tax=Rhizophagus clarus TaxID=94130 RepID=A0A8H3LH02_9GLOM|nr:pogo transposable element with KRAB domain [Rhizophagus clarus]
MNHENGHSKNKTAAKFNIQTNQLRNWISKKPQLLKVQPGQAICSGVGSFAFSNKWLDDFMRQKNLSNHRRTTVYDYPLAYIGNMNEMLVSFDLPSNTTIDELDARSVSTRITEHEKANFTVVLTCMADGTKLFPLIIFKLKNVPQGNFSSEIENIWTKRKRISNLQSLLVLDLFSAHIVDSVKRRFGEKNTNIAVIPGGLTSRLQPLDVSMRRNYNEWMVEAVKELTPAGNLKKPSYETVITGFLTITVLDKEISRRDEVEIPSDDERGNEKDKKGETDDEYVGEEREMDEETDEEYVDEKEETDEEYVDERGEEDKEGIYEGEEDGYDDEYYDHYDQGTNYVNVWND